MMLLYLFEASAIFHKATVHKSWYTYFPPATCFTGRQVLCLCAEIRQFIIESRRNGQQQGPNCTPFQINCSFHFCVVNET